MKRARLPETLGPVRALLDTAAVHRIFIPLDEPARRPDELAAALAVPVGSVAVTHFAEADGDRLAAIVPGDARLDLGKLAIAVGAPQRARLLGKGDLRKDQDAEDVPPVTGLPTVIDRSLLRREYVYGRTGDPLWVLKIGSAGLRRATNAIVADIVRSAPLPRAPRRQEKDQDAADRSPGHDG